MRTSTKTIAIVLSVVMVVCAFCATFTVSAEDTNLLLGKTCTYKNVAKWSMHPAEDSGLTSDTTDLFTDGAFRGDGTNPWNNDNAVADVTFDTMYVGPCSSSSFAGFYTFDLGESKEIAKVVIKGYREAHNRSWGQSNDAGDGVMIYVSDTAFDLSVPVNEATVLAFPADGTNAVASYEKTVIADAPLYGEENADQFFNATFNLTAGTTGRYLLVKTNGMLAGKIFQADEIEAYGPAANVPSEDSSDDVTSDDVTSDDVTSDDVTSDDVTSDDVTSDDVTSDDVTSDDVTSDDVTSDDVTSDDVTSDDVTSDDVTSDDPIIIDYVTFTVTLTDNGDGTATITATIPEGIGSGKIVIEVSDDLELVAGSLKANIGGLVQPNESYDRDGVTGACVAFSNSVVYAADTEVFSATYNVAEGADLDASDIIVDLWNLSDGTNRLATEKDGDVIKVIVGGGDISDDATSDDVTSDDVTSDDVTSDDVTSDDVTSDDVTSDDVTSDDVTSDDVTSDDVTSDDVTSDDVTSDDVTSDDVTSDDATSDDATSDDATSDDATSDDASAPIADDDDTPTGDAGMIAFAVLAVLSGAAVVVLKKRA